MAEPEQGRRGGIDHPGEPPERDQQPAVAELGSWEWDLAAGRATWSPELHRLFGLEAGDRAATGEAFSSLMAPDEAARFRQVVHASPQDGRPFVFDHHVTLEHRGVRVLESRGQAVLDGAGVAGPRVVATVQDVTESRALAGEERRFRTLVEESWDIVAILDRHGCVRYVSPSVDRLLGFAPAALLEGALTLVHPEDVAAVRAVLAEVASVPNGRRRLEFRVRDSLGAWKHLDALATNLCDEPDVAGVVLHCRDITEQRHAEALLVHQQLHDSLTGCPNRSVFVGHLQRALSRGARHGHGVVVFAIDLDRFKSINEVHGHDVGDAVLVAVAARIESSLRAYDAIARQRPVVTRLGGDEFFAMCEEVPDNVTVASIGQRLADAVSEPLVVEGRNLSVTATIGIAVNRGEDVDPETLLIQAQTAMQRVKDVSGTQPSLFDDEARQALDQHNERVAALAKAIATDQLRLYYQPKVDIPSGRLRGVEALVRWEDPERGMVPPDDFIPLAEECGLIGALGEWVLAEACRQQAAWVRDLGAAAPPMVCVNVSGRQLEAGFADVVGRIIADTGVLPEAVCVEITESAMMGDVGLAVTLMNEFNALGICVSIDDFGTGYSSLAHLKRFPIGELKIDKSFVGRLGENPEDTAIVAAIVAMAHALEILVVAEGVETADQLRRLHTLGCETAQGYLFSRPVPPPDLIELGPVLSPIGAPARPASAVDLNDVVLIVDDTADVRLLASLSLATSGFEVLEATTGEEALREARRAQPGCIVLDVSMPGMNGFEVCRALRDDPLTSAAAIVMLTSRDQAGDKVQAFSAGADDYLVKPFAPRELVFRIRQAMTRRVGAEPGS